MTLQEKAKGHSRMKTEDFSMSDVNHLTGQIGEVKEDVREIRASLSKIADAMTRLAVMESQNKNVSDRIDLVEAQVKAAEKEVAEIRLQLIRATSQLTGAVTTIKVLWTVIGASAVTILVKLFA